MRDDQKLYMTHSSTASRMQPTPVRVEGDRTLEGRATAGGTLLDAEGRVGLSGESTNLLSVDSGHEGEGGESSFAEHCGDERITSRRGS